MKLKDSQTLFGVPIVHLREHSKKYRLKILLLYLFDILLIFGSTAFMFFNSVRYEIYGFVLVAVCVVVNFVVYFKLGVEKWEVFNFYKMHSKCDIVERAYDVSAQTLYSVLYCTGYKRLKQNKTLQEYKELMLSACCENIKYARSIMKGLAKYEDVSGNLKCYIIIRGNRQYLIDFVSDESQQLEEENEDEPNHERAVV